MRKPLKNLNAFDTFLKAENENTKKTLRHFRKEFELYKRSFNLFDETVAYLHELTEKREFSEAKHVILCLICRIEQTIQAIKVLQWKGYYYDEAVLERSLRESMGLCAYFALNEKGAEDWLKGKDVEIPKIKLVDYMFLLLGQKEDKRERSVYAELSRYVHTDKMAISSLISNINKKRRIMSFQVIPQFEKDKMVMVSNFPTFMLCILIHIFRDELAERKKEILKFVKQYLNETDSSSN